MTAVDHVLAAIDGALQDWDVSDDAMRWSPDPEAVGDGYASYGEDEDWTPVSYVPRCWNGAPLEFEGTRLLTVRGVSA